MSERRIGILVGFAGGLLVLVGFGIPLRSAILLYSGLAVGASAWVAAAEIRKGIKHRDPLLAGLALKPAGMITIVALIAEAIYRTARVMPAWRVVVYTIALGAVFVGSCIQLVDFGRRNRRDGDQV